MRRSMMLLMLLPLAACDQRPSAPPPKQEISVRSAGQDKLHQLNELNRAITLKRALYASGAECRLVTKSGYVGEYENTSYWTATCQDKFKRTRDWALFIGPDESVQVRLCEDVVKAGLPACVIKDEAKPAPKPA
ncbi:MAG: hypothetical protein LH485_04680 [Sphingomonas bacterium]|nr:hypothetical protein [Sphingomonas bacterium]